LKIELEQFRTLFGDDDILRVLLTVVHGVRELDARCGNPVAGGCIFLQNMLRGPLMKKLENSQVSKWTARFVNGMSIDELCEFRDRLEAPPLEINDTPSPDAPESSSSLSGSSISAPVVINGWNSRAAEAATNENPRDDPDYGVTESATMASEATASCGGDSASVTVADDS
jgi:hypothetical protein